MTIDTPVANSGMDAVARIARRFRRQPVSVMHATSPSDLFAAEWKLPPYRSIAAGCIQVHTLCFHLRGAATVSKSSDGSVIRRHAAPGVASFVPIGDAARYSLGREITALEIYLSPALLQRCSEECADTVRTVSIQPFFAMNDAWLSGYFQMLAAEMASRADDLTGVDSLLLSQSQQLLCAYLLRRYADLGRHGRRELDQAASARRLPSVLLQRIADFVEQRLAADIRLGDLATLVHLSERHFIRAFRAATGITPYRYVVDKRLRAAAQLLHADDPRPIADVARATGFRSASHFAAEFRARYRVTPRRYRQLGDSASKLSP